MSPKTARTLRRYVGTILPRKVLEKNPGMSSRFYSFLKKRWYEMNARERCGFRLLMLAKRPLPAELADYAAKRFGGRHAATR